MKITGNTILITDGGTGIGFELAKQLIAHGNTIIICGRRASRLQIAKQRLPQLITRVCDLTDSDQRRDLVGWVTSEYKQLNILVNNAGIQLVVDFSKGSSDLGGVDDEVNINLLAPIHLSGMLIPHLRKQAHSAIVNVSSGLAYTPLAIVPVYCATKAAIHSLSLSIRFQLRETPVRVFEVAPPTVHTELSGRPNRPEGDEHAMSAEAVATGIVSALEHDQYEAPLGPAAGLYKQREALFDAINR